MARWSSLFVNRWNPSDSNWYGSFSIVYTLPEPPQGVTATIVNDGMIKVQYDGLSPMFDEVAEYREIVPPFPQSWLEWWHIQPHWCMWWIPYWIWISPPPLPISPPNIYTIDKVYIDGAEVTNVFTSPPANSPNSPYLVYDPTNTEYFYIGGLEFNNAYQLKITDTQATGHVVIDRVIRTEDNPHLQGYEHAREVIPMDEVMEHLGFYIENADLYEARARVTYKTSNIPSAGIRYERTVIYDIIKKGSTSSGGDGSGGIYPPWIPGGGGGYSIMDLLGAQYDASTQQLFVLTRQSTKDYKLYICNHQVGVTDMCLWQKKVRTDIGGSYWGWDYTLNSNSPLPWKAVLTTQELSGLSGYDMLGFDWSQVVWAHLDLKVSSGGGGGSGVQQDLANVLTVGNSAQNTIMLFNDV